MKTFVKMKGMDKETWLMYRRKGVCGSEASVVLGVNPYRSILQLWRDKTGRCEAEETQNEYAYWGNVMEPIVKKEFMRRTGLKVRAKNEILQSDEHEFMLADVDGIVKEADGSYSLFEAKTASEYKKSVWEKGIPEEYMAQVQHYLCVTGFAKAYVCGLIGGNTYICHEVYRDEAYIAELVEKERAFWECVRKDIPPKADGSKSTEEFLSQQYPKSQKTSMELPKEAQKLVDSYLWAEEKIKELTKKKNEAGNQLKELLKEHEKGYLGSHVIRWSTVEKRSLDSDKVKAFLGSSYDQYLSSSSYRKFSVA